MIHFVRTLPYKSLWESVLFCDPRSVSQISAPFRHWRHTSIYSLFSQCSKSFDYFAHGCWYLCLSNSSSLSSAAAAAAKWIRFMCAIHKLFHIPGDDIHALFFSIFTISYHNFGSSLANAIKFNKNRKKLKLNSIIMRTVHIIIVKLLLLARNWESTKENTPQQQATKQNAKFNNKTTKLKTI